MKYENIKKLKSSFIQASYGVTKATAGKVIKQIEEVLIKSISLNKTQKTPHVLRVMQNAAKTIVEDNR